MKIGRGSGIMQQELLAKLAQLPYVQSAGLTNFLPATGATLRYDVTVSDLAGPNQDGSMTIGTRMIGGDYLLAIRAQLVAGSWCPDLTLGGKVHRRWRWSISALSRPSPRGRT